VLLLPKWTKIEWGVLHPHNSPASGSRGKKTMSSRPAWDTEQVQSHPGLHSYTLSQKKEKKQRKEDDLQGFKLQNVFVSGALSSNHSTTKKKRTCEIYTRVWIAKREKFFRFQEPEHFKYKSQCLYFKQKILEWKVSLPNHSHSPTYQ
jgi:tRNA U34 2-thiouridine synthase MnmA/TrmU